MIRMSRVSASYDGGDTFAVRDVDLHVKPGELLSLIGASGCGKTTTLKVINRLIDPFDGTITVDGRDITTTDPVTLRRSIGYVFQEVGLFPHMTIGENIAVVPSLLGWKPRDIAARVNELLDVIQLDPEAYRDRFPRHLSGGQQQRIGLARALAARPRIMLMDEPFGALDPITRDELQREYVRLHQSLELTTVLVTHDMSEAIRLSDRIAVMHEGRLARCETPGELLADRDDPIIEPLISMPRRQADEIESIARQAGGQ